MHASGASADPFRYGYRQVVTQNQTGQPIYTRLPLQPSDFLDPEPGDEFAHGSRHDADVRSLRRILRWHHRHSPFLTVLCGVKLIFSGPGPHPAPDLFTVPNLAQPQRTRTQYDVEEEGPLPNFILEVTSPLLAGIDLVDKLPLYALAGVQEYFILDAAVDDPGPAYRWLAYRLDGLSYSPLLPAADGSLHSAVNRVGFTVSAGGNAFDVIDLRTGRPVTPDPSFDDSSADIQSEAASRAHALAAQLSRLNRNQKA